MKWLLRLLNFSTQDDEQPMVSESSNLTWISVDKPPLAAESRLAESLGIETQGGCFTPLIDIGTQVPTKKTQTFSTANNNQSRISIRLYRGDADEVIDTTFLGEFELSGFERARRGKPVIQVVLCVDQFGHFQIAAFNGKNGQAVSIERKK